MSIPDPTYPDFGHPVKVQCHTCGQTICGGYRGCRDFRGVMKNIKGHEEAHHPPYNRRLIDQLYLICEELNQLICLDGRVGRYVVSLF